MIVRLVTKQMIFMGGRRVLERFSWEDAERVCWTGWWLESWLVTSLLSSPSWPFLLSSWLALCIILTLCCVPSSSHDYHREYHHHHDHHHDHFNNIMIIFNNIMLFVGSDIVVGIFVTIDGLIDWLIDQLIDFVTIVLRSLIVDLCRVQKPMCL